MANSFGRRLTTTYLIIILLLLIGTGAIISVSLKQYYLRNAQASLENEVNMAVEMIEFDPESDQDPVSFLQGLAVKIAEATDTRVTMIDENGIVVADTEFDPRSLGPHGSRPEVYQALHGQTGVEIRYSESVGKQLVYVAEPFDNGQTKGVVRLARPLDEVEALYYQILLFILGGIVLMGLIAIAVSTRIAHNISRPLQDLTAAVEDIAQGNLSRRISNWSDDELGSLSAAVNNMAEHMDRNITEISTVRNRLATLLDNTVNGIIMVDMSARVTYANPAAVRLLAMEENFQGRKHVEVIQNYDLLEGIDTVRRKIIPIRKEVQLLTPEEKLVEVNVVPIINEGVPVSYYGGVLVVLNDITELKRLERVRRDFVANVSHELKTPVASISGFAETLMDMDRSDPDHVREFSEIIYNEAMRLSRLINRLLELSRLESGKSGLNIRNIDMVRLIQDTTAIIKQNVEGGLSIDIRRPAGQVLVECDRELIMQVLLNLMDNAINYNPEGEALNVILEDCGPQVKIKVADHGEGIPENEKERVFERFYRVDKARSRKTGGTGLGLSIVKHLVENHNGQVGIDKTPGGGATFWFILPKKHL